MRLKPIPAALALVALASIPVSAGAQAPAGGGSPGFSSSAPIDITAESLEVLRDQHMTVWKGNVEAIQGTTRIRTPQLSVFSAAKAGDPKAPTAALGQNFGDVQRMEATGPVYYVTPTQVAKGDYGVYEKVADTITLTGNVILTQDKNVVTGDKLVIQQKTGRSTLISSTAGTAAPKRVRGVFYPSQAPAGAPARPAPARKGA